ncbi:preprotein translocase subunit YajC [Sphingomonas ginkgonis]|uniref:Sec translocon accessory complex subunit YajC n=1 Tax=Sphingomonas ginkgonis TaxID=2315330 RepID=A0A429V7P2_9SPHN|nr:preprotein translocase subunit YajC [Sphingomonas ginkgonis]RST29968.1 preprotein translocase subunit YajC [Sphingomonas ginkgonis]
MSSHFLLSTAAAAGAPGGAAAGLSFLIPMGLMLLIFWLLVWRPQAQQVKTHRAAIAAVKKGDEVILGGGIRGRVTKLVGDDEAEVEIAPTVRVRVVKSTFTQVVTAASTKPAND